MVPTWSMTDQNMSVLFHAARRGHLEVVRVLGQNSVDMNASIAKGTNDCTCLRSFESKYLLPFSNYFALVLRSRRMLSVTELECSSQSAID